MERVNHPKYYNESGNKAECIDIIAHYLTPIGNAMKYLWRCGLKTEEGLSNKEKEIEDLKKGRWYINYWRDHYLDDEREVIDGASVVFHPTGFASPKNVLSDNYNNNVLNAFTLLWWCGLPNFRPIDEATSLYLAMGCIDKRIEELQENQ